MELLVLFVTPASSRSEWFCSGRTNATHHTFGSRPKAAVVSWVTSALTDTTETTRRIILFKTGCACARAHRQGLCKSNQRVRSPFEILTNSLARQIYHSFSKCTEV